VKKIKDYGNGYLNVNNKNLAATKTMFESVFAASYKGRSFLGEFTIDSPAQIYPEGPNPV
jgi:hypothetical protein